MVIFVSNLIGAVLFAAAAVYGDVLPASTFAVLFDEVAQKLDQGLLQTIYALAFLIPASGLIHCIAGSSEVLMSVFAGEVPFVEYLVGFLILATLENAVGGVFLVALLNYGQVAG